MDILFKNIQRTMQSSVYLCHTIHIPLGLSGVIRLLLSQRMIWLVILYTLLARVELKILILAIMDFFLFHILQQPLESTTSGQILQS